VRVALYNYLTFLIVVSIKHRMIKVRQYLSSYNLFEIPSSTIHTQRREILTTRLYLALLITSSITMLFYTGLVVRTKTETVSFPSQSTYESLQSLYSDTLQCPCSNISMSYKNVTIYLNATFHPICLSDFVSEQWLTYFNYYGADGAWWLQLHDFRKWGILFFQLLQSFCSLANSTVYNATEQFQLSSFITSVAIPSTQFQAQVNEVIGLFQKSISTLFARPLQIFRASNQGNALLSLMGTNWALALGKKNY
jgi:hypothetical protein